MALSLRIRQDPELAAHIVAHPEQMRACAVIAELLARLRTLDSPTDYDRFQRALFAEVHRADGLLGAASRSVKRLDRLKPVEDPPNGEPWQTEHIVMKRVVRQLRSVGDALAWRLFDFDRRILLALAQNQRPGPMTSKQGLPTELNEVVTAFNRYGEFALLHDLTNDVRIADVTRFTADGPLLVEVKKDPSRQQATQRRRAQHAIDVVMKGAPLRSSDGAETNLFVLREPFRTRLRELEDGLALADERGVIAIRLGRGWVVTCISIAVAAGVATTEQETERLWQTTRERAFRKARMYESEHHVQTAKFDDAGSGPTVAPFTVFPFEPDVCARLACDYLVYQSVITWDRLAAAFRAEGWEVSNPLPEAAGEMTPRAPVVVMRRGATGMTLRQGAMHQLLYELVEPAAFAAAFSEVAASGQSAGSAVFTFANERNTWR